MNDKPTLEGEIVQKLGNNTTDTQTTSKFVFNEVSIPFAQTLRPGLVVQGRYMLKKKLGVGGFALVYLAHDAQIDREVAIKFLNIQGIEDNPQKQEEFTARFEREAKLAARVRHSAVMEVYEYGMANNGSAPFIVMEYLQGHDLEEHLERFGGIAPDQFLKLFIPCVEALGFAHKEGIIHKDLKPSNLFIKYPGERRESMSIVDFGVAHIQAQYSKRLTQTGNLFATPSYIAPEYAQHQTVCPALDIYQMGLILVEGLTGRTVVDVDDFMLAIIQHAQGQLNIPTYLLDSPLGPILRKSLALDYNDRYQDGFEFADALRQLDPLEIPPKPSKMTLVALNKSIIEYRVSIPTPIQEGTDSAITLDTGDFPGFVAKTPDTLPAPALIPTRTETTAADHTLELPPQKDKKSKMPLLVLLFLLLASVGVAIGIATQIKKPTSPKPLAKAQTVQPKLAPKAPRAIERTIIINSPQAGVQIFDGEERLGTVPVTIKRALNDTPLQLKATLDKHIAQHLKIPLNKATELTRTVELEKQVKIAPIKAKPKIKRSTKPTTTKTKPAKVNTTSLHRPPEPAKEVKAPTTPKDKVKPEKKPEKKPETKPAKKPTSPGLLLPQ